MFKTIMICLALTSAALMGPSAAVAKDGPHMALSDAASASGWQAVGRLDIQGSGFCTGTLISEHLVLTAAHCVYSSVNGQLVDAADLVFKAGYRDGQATATRHASRFIVHGSYIHNSAERVRNVPFDIAVIELAAPIEHTEITPFQLHRKPQLDEAVTVVSYARGRAAAPSMEEDCRMFDSYVGALIYTCDVDFGSSGAPVFIMTQDGPQIASVITSKSKLDNKKVSLGAPLETAVGRLLTQLASADPQNDQDGFVKASVIKASVDNTEITNAAARVQAQLGEANAAASKLPQISR